MATLPRTSKQSSKIYTPPAVSHTFFAQLARHQSDSGLGFDAGINTSAAWNEHLERAPRSDEDHSPHTPEANARPARALYQFEGKPEFREMSVEAGDAIGVIREDLADGWSLVRSGAGEVGLLPRTYYTFTADFAASPTLELPPTLAQQPALAHASSSRREGSTASLTPRGTAAALPIVPQTTGEWRVFPSFRQSLLGGKSLNRFSNFVTSGAEEWVLKGSPETTDADADAASSSAPRHEKLASDDSLADEGQHRASVSRMGGEADLPPFRVLVHSPSKRSDALAGAYTVYSVTSLFQPPPEDPQSRARAEDEDEDEQEFAVPAEPARITVHRRFSHFVALHTALARRLPGIALPPLPEKQYAGRFSTDFVEARRGDLERYVDRVVRHPVARYAEIVMFFLGCESDLEWKRQLPHHLSLPPAGPAFFSQVYHPAFNVDADDASETLDRFDSHTRAVGKGVQGLRNVFGRVREARVEMSQAERLLSYSLLSLITSKPLSSASMTGISEEEAEGDDKGNGLLNSDNAWCWRDECEDCLKLTKAMQKTSESLQNVADLYDDHARRTQLATHESLKGVAHPYAIYEPVVDTHRATLIRYKEATKAAETDEDVAARCETVLNTTMAEMETYHSQKNEDFADITKEHLDGEIEFYEQVISKLRAARRNFDSPQYEALGQSPRQPSMYERELENPRVASAPLPQPCPHVYDSAPMRPVSVAIQEGVGMLLRSSSSSSSSGRGSVFGKFW
ncbi:hypothetical protein FIBSPDRAFT_734676 [Athelia psychrophila]|uniref:PX-domain-containing protein n=1 Tax=Athelia psychrophila TaxID=1759441 RepID=A0A166NH06_9AGAM|nr:hypothetical protein FIBSPDRAFT_734676 [Fibularhizoctonia sp. CBS 109695]